jgi:hypothetical protein
MQTMAGIPQTKLLVAELMLTKVSIISPYHIFNVQKKRERDCIKIHHVLCPNVFLFPEPAAGFMLPVPEKEKTMRKISQACGPLQSLLKR